MKELIKLVDLYLMNVSKKYLLVELGNNNYREFIKLKKEYMQSIYKEIPKLGRSIFSNSYYVATCYFFYFPAFRELQYEKEKIIELIWGINEEMMKNMPEIIRKIAGRYYINYFHKRGPWATKKNKCNQLNAFDWKVEYRQNEKNDFEIDIMECYVVKIAKKLHMEDLLPGICRMDYLFSHYFNQGFIRTKTLGDGDDRCNCHWKIPGETIWPIVNEEYR
jgi:hypothetical protein